MIDQYAELRAALDAVPCIKWTASRSTVHIPETEDWAGKDLSITGLDKQVARKLARYIADTHPKAIRTLLAERDALIHDNAEYVGAANALATENERLREALRLTLPMAKGYATVNPVGSNQQCIEQAEAALTQQEQV